MQNIYVHRYGEGVKPWDGYLEPEDRSWILWIDEDNIPHLWAHRDISPEEAKERGLMPYDPSTKYGVGGEYVPMEKLPEGEKPTPNRPLTPS